MHKIYQDQDKYLFHSFNIDNIKNHKKLIDKKIMYTKNRVINWKWTEYYLIHIIIRWLSIIGYKN